MWSRGRSDKGALCQVSVAGGPPALLSGPASPFWCALSRALWGHFELANHTRQCKDFPTTDHYATHRCAQHCLSSWHRQCDEADRGVDLSSRTVASIPSMRVLRSAGVHNPGAAPSVPGLHSLSLASVLRYRLHFPFYSFCSYLQWSFPITTSR
jgi:hypothetical protein